MGPNTRYTRQKGAHTSLNRSNPSKIGNSHEIHMAKCKIHMAELSGNQDTHGKIGDIHHFNQDIHGKR